MRQRQTPTAEGNERIQRPSRFLWLRRILGLSAIAVGVSSKVVELRFLCARFSLRRGFGHALILDHADVLAASLSLSVCARLDLSMGLSRSIGIGIGRNLSVNHCKELLRSETAPQKLERGSVLDLSLNLRQVSSR